MWELATVVCFDSALARDGVAPKLSAVEELISNIQTWLAGVVYIDQNEVRFWYTQFHSIMVNEGLTSDSEYLWEGFKHTAHAKITELCREYLSTQRRRIDGQGIPGH